MELMEARRRIIAKEATQVVERIRWLVKMIMTVLL
jgi:hypothetical protein